jgi:uncharacterized protein (TIGR02996 family)
MSTAEQAAFLRAVIDRPDDNLPRLIFADWLDEHGEPERAEFIRVQCRQLPYDENRVRRLARRFFEGQPDPISGKGSVSCSPYYAAKYRQVSGERLRFHAYRGFVEHCYLPAAVFLHHAETLTAVAPLRDVTLSNKPWDDPDHRWGWTIMLDDSADRWSLPAKVFARLPPTDDGLPQDTAWRWYRSEARAIDAALDAIAAEWPGIAFGIPSHDEIKRSRVPPAPNHP